MFEYVAFVMNRTAQRTLNWCTPYEALTGQTPDISVILHFTFWEQCLIKKYSGSGQAFPSTSIEVAVRCVGPAENVGHSLTFKAWNETTQELLYRSRVKKITTDQDINRRRPSPSLPPFPRTTPASLK